MSRRGILPVGLRRDSNLRSALAVDVVALETAAALRMAGVDSILLKGRSFARWLYRDSTSRRYTDVDLLIDPSAFEAAGKVLQQLGFNRLPLDTIGSDKPWHADTWERQSGGVVDLHRTIVGVGVDPERAFAILSARTEPMELGDSEVTILNEVARAFHVSAHGAQHGEGKWLEDLRRALDQVPFGVWAEAGNLARELDAVAAFATGLSLLPEGRDVARRLGVLEVRSTEAALYADGAGSGAFTLEWISSKGTIREKSVLVVRKLLPPAEYVRYRYQVPPGKRFPLLVAYVRRVGDVVARTPRALVQWRRARRASR